LNTVLLDNDVLFKTCIYGLLQDILSDTAENETKNFIILGAACFIVHKKLKKRPPTRGAAQATIDFDACLSQIEKLEPTDDEIRIAAKLESAAKNNNLQLDEGESQLCAVLINRSANYIYTGDKRAIISIQQLLNNYQVSDYIKHRIVCLEQLILRLTIIGQPDRIRDAICAEAHIDRALSNCFSCCSQNTNVDSWREGLLSYIKDIQKNAQDILCSDFVRSP